MYRTWSYTGRTVPSPTGKLELLPHNTAMLLDLHNHNLMINLYQVRQNPGPPNSCGRSSCNYAEGLKHRPASSEVGLCHLHESHRQSWNLHPGTIFKGNIQVAIVIIGNSNWIYWLEEPGPPPTPSWSTAQSATNCPSHTLSHKFALSSVSSFHSSGASRILSETSIICIDDILKISQYCVGKCLNPGQFYSIFVSASKHIKISFVIYNWEVHRLYAQAKIS